MKRTDRPKTGKTTYHRDGTVTVWDVRAGEWARGADVPDALLASLSEPERSRVVSHTTKRGPGRPPLAVEDRRRLRSIRYTDAEWEAVCERASEAGELPAVYVRRCSLH